MQLERIDLDEWGAGLPDSGFGVFHTPAALETLSEYFPGETRLYGGYKGEQLVGLLPLFIWEGPLGARLIASPPQTLHVPYLGPLIMPTSPKQRKREKVHTAFTEAVVEDLDLDGRSAVTFSCTPEYQDPRPYDWNGLTVYTGFTYHLDVADRDPDEIMRSFSKSRRREIRNALESSMTVGQGTIADAECVYQAHRRLADREDFWFIPEWAYVHDLLSALDERARVYVARDGAGEFAGGIVVLYSNDLAYFWMGGTDMYDGDVSVNSLLHWHIIRDLATDSTGLGVSTYDMIGSGIQRLARFKSKFGPTPRPYYQIGSMRIKRDVAKAVWRRGRYVSHRLHGRFPATTG